MFLKKKKIILMLTTRKSDIIKSTMHLFFFWVISGLIWESCFFFLFGTGQFVRHRNFLAYYINLKTSHAFNYSMNYYIYRINIFFVFIEFLCLLVSCILYLCLYNYILTKLVVIYYDCTIEKINRHVESYRCFFFLLKIKNIFQKGKKS